MNALIAASVAEIADSTCVRVTSLPTVLALPFCTMNR